ncbi:hypothetical protein BDV98DRAFT_575432 [Pterulicium gracile]|uniref:Uncharacterized protein n=1 Tax=Pterulicium gracile TaxID=1884261 RepID=A0A5C3Q4B8_9AGAR|nr:hypothetical protein BDV98DRAFT_575432 [Pterula gracilis]
MSTAKQQLQSYILTQRNLIAPVHRLPDGIQLHIFQMLVNETDLHLLDDGQHPTSPPGPSSDYSGALGFLFRLQNAGGHSPYHPLNSRSGQGPLYASSDTTRVSWDEDLAISQLLHSMHSWPAFQDAEH